ncbi:hypothetical protein, partial [Rhizobium johnstonii]|uniref:hypothetical protein n=1 Tax=Rhizobium johnstonii TaxID=3019933 RepID=UPI003F99A496
PGAVLSEIARAAGIHFSQLFRWRKELFQIDEPSMQVSSTLVPVIVSEAAPAAQPPALEAPTQHTIENADQLLRVDVDVHADTAIAA